LHDWYSAEEKDYDLFAKKYPLNEELETQSTMIDAMNIWCTSADIQGTPTILVNGRRLPEIIK